MKPFLRKLVQQHKLQLVEESENVAQGYLLRSAKTLQSAKALLSLGNLEDAIALTYYSMYYELLALLFRVGIKCENHAAAIFLLKEIFDVDNANLERAKKERVDKQYYLDFSVTAKEVKDAITIAEESNALLLQVISTLTRDTIDKARNKFQQSIEKKK
ncbi:MAG: HEPN domain-containing protein [Nanoarchaeota archaeon]|nr:HEPN domain-containing protein [Nanoarchaeota archaeon]